METVNQTSTVTPRRMPWNKGKLIGPKPPLQPNHVWAIRTRLQLAGRTRDLALFNLAINSKLRACDLVSVKVENVAPHGYAIDRASVRQNKTGRPVRIEIASRRARRSTSTLRRPGSVPAISCSVAAAAKASPRPPAVRLARQHRPRPVLVRPHSLRRTKATLIYRRTGNLRAVQLLLGHTKVESTVRYLGIEVDDALAIAEQIDV
jgi:integrase